MSAEKPILSVVPPPDELDLWADPSLDAAPDPLDGDEKTEFSDARLAYRLAERFEERGTPVLFSAGLGWLYWTGKRWRPTEEGRVVGHVMNFALDWLRDLAGERGKSDQRDKVATLLSEPRAKRLVRAMQALIRAEASDFDRHPDLLNVQNGVVDLRTGELRPHDPALLLTRMTRVKYRPGAVSRDWEKAKRALPSNLREYLLDRLGQAITGHVPGDDKIVFNVGGGGNGKSTFLDPVRLCLGDYASAVPQKLLLANPSEHPTEFMTLRGLRLAVLEELPETGRLNTQRFKTITGTETITARGMRQDFVSFAASHALFVNTNHVPAVVETDHGTWRRLEQIAFRREYRGSQKDETLRQRVKRKAVLEAVLADLVEHAGRWYSNSQIMSVPPDEVVQATAAWRGDSDDLLAFFTDHLEADPHGTVALSNVLEVFNEWLTGQQRSPWSAKLLKARLRANESLPVRYSVAPGEEQRSRNYTLPSGTPAPKNGHAKEVWKGVRWVAEA